GGRVRGLEEHDVAVGGQVDEGGVGRHQVAVPALVDPPPAGAVVDEQVPGVVGPVLFAVIEVGGVGFEGDGAPVSADCRPAGVPVAFGVGDRGADPGPVGVGDHL